jgi:hypothetical protein
VLYSIETEAERVRKARLRHVQPFAYGFHIDFSGDAHLVTGIPASQEFVDFVEPRHHVFKHCCHDLPLVSGKNLVCALREFVLFPLYQIRFLARRISGNEKNWKLLVAKDVDFTNPRLPIPFRPARTLRNPQVPQITSPHFELGRNHDHNALALNFAEKHCCSLEVRGRFNHSLHLHCVLQWTSCVKRKCPLAHKTYL